MAESFDPSSALIAREKVTGYLLSHLHPVGRYKAAFFARLGYSADAPEVFERDVAALLRSRVIELGITPYVGNWPLEGCCGDRSAAEPSFWRCGLYFPTNGHPGW
ncbi:MAG: DUF6883 domain-containing protein [Gammaproteobacteria bacterium]